MKKLFSSACIHETQVWNIPTFPWWASMCDILYWEDRTKSEKIRVREMRAYWHLRLRLDTVDSSALKEIVIIKLLAVIEYQLKAVKIGFIDHVVTILNRFFNAFGKIFV